MNSRTKMLHTLLCAEDVGKYAFLPGSPERSERISKYFDDPYKIAQNREHTTYGGTLNGEKVIVTSTGMGGPSACICLEELVKLGVRYFIRIGTCSTTCAKVGRGDVFIPNSAVRMEGTSLHYAPIEYPAVPDFELMTELKAAAERSGYPFHIGTAISRDSFYTQYERDSKPVSCELNAKWEAYQKMGAMITEMECASLFIAGASLSVKTAAVLVCATNFMKYGDDAGIYPGDTEFRAIEIAIEAMRALICGKK